MPNRALPAAFTPRATVLVAVGERTVTEILQTALRGAHCRVICAPCARAAITISDDAASAIHLVIADAELLEVPGIDLVDALRVRRPRMAAILLAVDGAALRSEAAARHVLVLPKPIRVGTLMRVVSEALQRGGASRGRGRVAYPI